MKLGSMVAEAIADRDENPKAMGKDFRDGVYFQQLHTRLDEINLELAELEKEYRYPKNALKRHWLMNDIKEVEGELIPLFIKRACELMLDDPDGLFEGYVSDIQDHQQLLVEHKSSLKEMDKQIRIRKSEILAKAALLREESKSINFQLG